MIDPDAAAALLAALDATERRVADAYRAGYRDGHRTGWEIGYAHAHEEVAAAWSEVAAKVHAAAGQRTPADHAAMDASAAAGDPCPARCGRCSRCIRAHAVQRHGGDYPGGPATWTTETEKGAA